MGGGWPGVQVTQRKHQEVAENLVSTQEKKTFHKTLANNGLCEDGHGHEATLNVASWPAILLLEKRAAHWRPEHDSALLQRKLLVSTQTGGQESTFMRWGEEPVDESVPTSETCTGLQSCCCQAPSCLQPSLCGLDPTSNVQRRESSFGGVERCSWTESSGQPWGVRGANAQAPFLSVIGFRINWDLDSVVCCDLQTYSLKAGTETPNTAETSPPAAERHTPSKCHVKSCSSDWVCR